MKEELETLKDYFYEVKENWGFERFFTIEYGANAVILIPKETHLQKYCIKTPMTKTFKEYIIDLEMNDFMKEYYSQVIKDKGSICGDIDSFKKISLDDDLFAYIPNFYDWNDEFIIMDYLSGDFIKIETNFKNHEKNPLNESLQEIYKVFTEKGYEFCDFIEGATTSNGDIKLIDLDGIKKLRING